MSMWFNEKGNARQCYYQVSFWETRKNGEYACYDEIRFHPGDEAKVFKYIGCDGVKVEVVFLNGDVYELSATFTRNWWDEHMKESAKNV